MNLPKVLRRFEMRISYFLCPQIERSVEFQLEHHTTEIDNYLGLLRKHPQRARELIGEHIEDYLENHLPEVSGYLRENLRDKRGADMFDRRCQELKGVYEETPQF